MGVLSLTRNSFLKKNINKSSMLRYTNAYKFTIRGMKWVAMARHGPILKDNEATGSGKVFKYLPGLRDTTKKSKMAAKAQKSKNTVFYRIFLYRLFGVSRWDHIYIYRERESPAYTDRSEGPIIRVRGCLNGIFHPWA